MPLSASIFRRGGPKKELFDVINEDVNDEAELNEKLAELEQLLHSEKIGRELSAAVWRPALHACELLRQRKMIARDIGFIRNRKVYLHIEEAVFLLDQGDLLLFVEELEGGPDAASAAAAAAGTGAACAGAAEEGGSGPHGGGSGDGRRLPCKTRMRLLSIQEAFDLMLSTGVPLERYLLYGSLCRSGYLVMRHPSRWLLARREAPQEVWGAGAWAGCYGRKPTVPGGGGGGTAAAAAAGGGQQQQQQQPMVMQQQLAAAGVFIVGGVGGGQQQQPQWDAELEEFPAEPAAAAGAAAGAAAAAAAPMEVDGAPAASAQPPPQQQTGVVAGPEGGASDSGTTAPPAVAATATAAASPSSAACCCRGWWRPVGPKHPYLAGVPEAFFQELPPARVEERLATSLLASFPNLRPFPTIASLIVRQPPQPVLPALDPQRQQQQAQQPASGHEAGAAQGCVVGAAAAAAGAAAIAAAEDSHTPAGDCVAAATRPVPSADSGQQQGQQQTPETQQGSSSDRHSSATAQQGQPSLECFVSSGADIADRGVGDRNGGSSMEGIDTTTCGDVSLGTPGACAHFVFDVYKPKSFVSRYKNQFPAVQTHVAMCSEGPPSLGEMRAADAAAAAVASGEGGRPAPVIWAAVLNGDIALYGIGEADLLRLI